MFKYKDQIILQCVSGSGGKGMLSFHRTRKNPRGGPDGGDGGQGGSIIFQSSLNLRGFEHLRKKKKYKAESGKEGGKQLKQGKKGKDLIITVPMGTTVKNIENQILIDFNKVKQEVFLTGAKGGRGNAFFKNSLNQAPRHFQKGQKGKSQTVILEEKPLIDIAIIGKVNTGKSSFFNLVTRAKSKVASYPYTTLVPHIGQLNLTSESCFIMDIPGLEQGACKSIFKGLAFLRSLQRAQILLHFLDSHSDSLLEDLKDIEKEITIFDKTYPENYFDKLKSKKIFYIITKVDDKRQFKQRKSEIQKIKTIKNKKIFFISNKTKKGIQELLQVLLKELSIS
ncbi:MAG: GTPase ObgE [Bdellovibrionales bacterium]|nr:GTPase ObgE [Bdellovibrionales bacterium]